MIRPAIRDQKRAFSLQYRNTFGRAPRRFWGGAIPARIQVGGLGSGKWAGPILGFQWAQAGTEFLEHDALSGAGGEFPGQFEGRSHFGQKNLPSIGENRAFEDDLLLWVPPLEGKVRDTSRHTGPKKGPRHFLHPGA